MTTPLYAQPDRPMIAPTVPFESAPANVIGAPALVSEAPAQPFDNQLPVAHSGAVSMVIVPITSTQAILSVVFGLLSFFPLPIIGSIVAIVTGYLARREISAANGQLGGARQALIGMALGAAMLVFWMLAACVTLAISISAR